MERWAFLGWAGVTYCAVCDGPLFKGMKVAVIGADKGLGESHRPGEIARWWTG